MTIQEFYDELKKHDWYYMMSDSHGVYCAGERNWKRIKKLAADGGQEFQDLLEKYLTHMNTGEPWGNKQQLKPERPQ